jgi:hypothetical protein
MLACIASCTDLTVFPAEKALHPDEPFVITHLRVRPFKVFT